MNINWYFQRQPLAKHLADSYTALGKERIAMFANRQKGKTQFCLQDLLPEMESRNYFGVYIDFWSDKSDPYKAFANGVANASLRLHTFKQPLKLSSFKVSTPTTLGIKAELGLSTQSPTAFISAADEAIQYLLTIANHRPVFMVLDEIQHLATQASFDEFVAKLRSFMVNQSKTCRYPIKAIFIGSDQARLADLFKSSKAPFYRATDVEDFPELDKNFTDFMLSNYQQISGNSLSSEQAFDLFKQNGRMPAAFTDLIKNMLSSGINNFEQALEGGKYFADAEAMYQQQLDKLNNQDVAIIVLLARGMNRPYSESFLRSAAILAEKEEVSKSSAQGSIRKLSKKGLVITKGHGVWNISDSSMQDWLIKSTEKIKEKLVN